MKEWRRGRCRAHEEEAMRSQAANISKATLELTAPCLALHALT